MYAAVEARRLAAMLRTKPQIKRKGPLSDTNVENCFIEVPF
jgi:hypothetical protein